MSTYSDLLQFRGVYSFYVDSLMNKTHFRSGDVTDQK